MQISDKTSKIFLPNLSTTIRATPVPRIWNKATRKAQRPETQSELHLFAIL
jgi:hypothetical protein